MSRIAKIFCQEVVPPIDRRSVIAGIAGLMVLAPLAKAQAEDELRPTNLVGPDGGASDFARSLANRKVRVRGYLAPSLDGVEFALSDSSPGACQLCGAIHDPGSTIAIRSASTEGAPPIFEPVLVEGQLMVTEPSGAVCLFGATTRTV